MPLAPARHRPPSPCRGRATPEAGISLSSVSSTRRSRQPCDRPATRHHGARARRHSAPTEQQPSPSAGLAASTSAKRRNAEKEKQKITKKGATRAPVWWRGGASGRWSFGRWPSETPTAPTLWRRSKPGSVRGRRRSKLGSMRGRRSRSGWLPASDFGRRGAGGAARGCSISGRGRRRRRPSLEPP